MKRRLARGSGASREPSASEAVAELDRQVERGSLFAHSAIGSNVTRLRETQAFVHGLYDVLMAKGMVLEGELAAAVERVQAELDRRGDLPAGGVTVRLDEAAPSGPPVEVDCKARMPVCKA